MVNSSQIESQIFKEANRKENKSESIEYLIILISSKVHFITISFKEDGLKIDEIFSLNLNG
jgi:hypothetical protein